MGNFWHFFGKFSHFLENFLIFWKIWGNFAIFRKFCIFWKIWKKFAFLRIWERFAFFWKFCIFWKKFFSKFCLFKMLCTPFSLWNRPLLRNQAFLDKFLTKILVTIRAKTHVLEVNLSHFKKLQIFIFWNFQNFAFLKCSVYHFCGSWREILNFFKVFSLLFFTLSEWFLHVICYNDVFMVKRAF